MDRFSSSNRPEDSSYSGLGDLGFDRPPPPAPPKRLQRISRSTNNHSSQQQQQQQQQVRHAQPLSAGYVPPYNPYTAMPAPPQQYLQQQQQYQYQQPPQQQRGQTISRQRLQRDSHQPQQQQQQYQYQQPRPGQSQGYQPQFHSQQHLVQQHQQQQHLVQQHQQQQQHPQQYHQQPQPSAPNFAYDPLYSPSVQSDSGARPLPSMAPNHPRASSSAANFYPSQNQTSPPVRPASGLPVPYPSAMVVGGGMPSNSRIVPSPALMSAVASTDISRQQREQDLANALGRRRPTQGSVSSTGSGDHYRPNPPVSTMSELPFNGNAGVDYGMGTTAAAQASRYRTALPNQPTVDMRVGRSASTASSSSGGYRGSYAPSPFATQRRPLQATPEQNQLRKQSSTISVNNSGRYVQAPGGNYDRIGGAAAGSPDMHHAHLGSRSAPDLNLDAMKSAINAVSHDLDSNPVPQIPTAYSGTAHNALPQHHQLHHSHLATSHPLAAASTLSIKTDLSQSDVPAQVGALYTAPTAQLEDVPSTSTGNIASRHSSRSSEPAVASGGRMAPKTPMTSDLTATAISPGSSVAAPVNTELVALLENVRPVYPAMLSLVANTFYEIMSQVLQTHTRNGLEYTECFTGRDAVDAIYAIIKAADRNLAIVVGRALEQQKLFHDVDYEKRLRDDSNELYAFDSDTIRALTRAEVSAEEDDDEVDEASTLNHEPVIRRNESFQDSGSSARVPPSVINGVFVMLTDCYSPTCSSTQPCYSVTCPRQRSQQDHLRKTAKSNVATEMKQEKLWSMSVPKEVLKSVSRQELDRQERLYEVFYGEKDYVRDLCILRDLYMKPLHNGDIVREDRRKNFITKVFKNALAILAENMELQRALEKRQKESFVCYQVGDVFLPFVQHLEAYLEYCANQPYSMYFLEAEKRTNTKLVEFLEKTDRRPECRKLGVQHFLTRPPTRLARYPLVLKAVLKYTPVGHPDRETIPHVIGRIEAMLNRINTETGKAQNRLRLYKVDEKLVCPAIDRNDLRLTDDQRKLVRDSQLRKRGGNDSSIIQVLLLDHMLLMCRVKVDSHTGEEKYSIYKHPIPLQMLTICYPDDPGSMRPRMAACRDSSEQSPAAGNTAFVTSPGGTSTIGTSKSLPSATGSGTGGGTVVNRPTIISIDHSDSQKDKYMYSLQITHLGRRGFTVTLYANKQADRQQWYQCIEQQQLELMERHRKFELVPVACQFPPGIRVNTADVYDQGRAVVIGTDRGLYLGVAGKPRSFQLLSHLRHDRVYQVEIHESLNVMAMVADKDRNLYVYPLDLLMTTSTNSKHGTRIKPLHSHVSFFRFGQFRDMDILCSVKSTTLSNQTIIHVYKPMINNQKSRSLGRFLSLGGETTADAWKCIRECYIAAESTSLHFLRSRLCVGCSRGFEIVDLESMNTQSLLDPADASLGFINKRDTSHPIALFRVHDGQFLLCYDEFAFYVNRNGQRARSNWMIHWVGTPTSFKYEYPYILAFDGQFIEIYHVETASVVQVIITGNCTSLSPNKTHVNLCITSPSPTQSQEVLRIQHILAQDPLST